MVCSEKHSKAGRQEKYFQNATERIKDAKRRNYNLNKNNLKEENLNLTPEYVKAVE